MLRSLVGSEMCIRDSARTHAHAHSQQSIFFSFSMISTRLSRARRDLFLLGEIFDFAKYVDRSRLSVSLFVCFCQFFVRGSPPKPLDRSSLNCDHMIIYSVARHHYIFVEIGQRSRSQEFFKNPQNTLSLSIGTSRIMKFVFVRAQPASQITARTAGVHMGRQGR